VGRRGTDDEASDRRFRLHVSSRRSRPDQRAPSGERVVLSLTRAMALRKVGGFGREEVDMTRPSGRRRTRCSTRRIHRTAGMLAPARLRSASGQRSAAPSAEEPASDADRGDVRIAYTRETCLERRELTGRSRPRPCRAITTSGPVLGDSKKRSNGISLPSSSTATLRGRRERQRRAGRTVMSRSAKPQPARETCREAHGRPERDPIETRRPPGRLWVR